MKFFFAGRSQKVSTILSFLPLGVIAYFYLPYAFRAWFCQDDFGFLARYSEGLYWHEAVDFSNFGRFVSRNVYWSGLSFLSHERASVFFLFNAALVLTGAALLARALWREDEPALGTLAGAIYQCLPATMFAYSWLSSSQHLLGHWFVFLFLLLFRLSLERHGGKVNGGWLPALLGVFLLGLYSNVFVGLVLSLPVLHLVARPEARRDRGHWALLAVGGALFAFFVLSLRRHPDEAYATRLAADVIATNLVYYFGHPVLAGTWLLAMPAGFVFFWRKGRWREAWLCLASLLFYVPFSTLVHQRYPQYGTLPHLFWSLALWSWAYDVVPKGVGREWTRPALTGAAALILLLATRSPARRFTAEPRGADQRRQVEELNSVLAQTSPAPDKPLCFWPRRPVDNTTGVKMWDIPREWWFLGFGNAFTLFVDPRREYVLAAPGPQCAMSFLMEGPRLVKAE